MIKPTVGCVVWYRPKLDDGLVVNGKEPLSAQIVCVWSDHTINIAGYDANGTHFARTSVHLVQDEDTMRPSHGFAEWMPYQKGQAARQEVNADGFAATVALLIDAAESCEANAEIGADITQVSGDKARAENYRMAIALLSGGLARDVTLVVETVARVAHEINRAYCAAFGDHTQPAWEDAPEWQRNSAIDGVLFHIENPDAGPEASHNRWMEQKVADGWTYGPTKVPELKKHPCIVPFSDLPPQQQAKDFLFRAVVHSLK